MAIAHQHPLRAIAPPTSLSKPAIHPQHHEIETEVATYLSEAWEWPSVRTRLGFLSWKLSDVAVYMFAQGDLYRVKLACELLLLGFLMDGELTLGDYQGIYADCDIRLV